MIDGGTAFAAQQEGDAKQGEAGRSSIVMLSAEAEALSVAKGKHLAAWRARPFAEFTLSEANGLRVTRFGNLSERLWGQPLRSPWVGSPGARAASPRKTLRV